MLHSFHQLILMVDYCQPSHSTNHLFVLVFWITSSCWRIIIVNAWCVCIISKCFWFIRKFHTCQCILIFTSTRTINGQCLRTCWLARWASIPLYCCIMCKIRKGCCLCYWQWLSSIISIMITGSCCCIFYLKNNIIISINKT